MDPFEGEQEQFCLSNEYECLLTRRDQIVGVATGTRGAMPINGLRHDPVGETSGWYIWCGIELSEDPEFFTPIHAEHLEDQCPEITKFLGLPPGHRFLTEGDYTDIWFD